MAFIRTALALAILACISYVKANSEPEDLTPLLANTEEKLKNATTHVNHMMGLDPLPHADKLQPLVKNETDHLAYELKKIAGKLQDAVKEGEHQAELKDAVTAASSKLTEAAATLEHAGSDLKQDNTHYLAAAEHWLQALKLVQEAKPCDKITPVVKDSLNELSHDMDNYQWGIHNVIGAHEGEPNHEGHHHHDNSHHVHQHHGSSSEESHESHESKEHSHHSHH